MWFQRCNSVTGRTLVLKPLETTLGEGAPGERGFLGVTPGEEKGCSSWQPWGKEFLVRGEVPRGRYPQERGKSTLAVNPEGRSSWWEGVSRGRVPLGEGKGYSSWQPWGKEFPTRGEFWGEGIPRREDRGTWKQKYQEVWRNFGVWKNGNS